MELVTPVDCVSVEAPLHSLTFVIRFILLSLMTQRYLFSRVSLYIIKSYKKFPFNLSAHYNHKTYDVCHVTRHMSQTKEVSSTDAAVT